MRRHIRRFVLPPAGRLCRGLLRAVLGRLIFLLCLGLTLRLLGLPVPRVNDVLRRFEAVSRLADVLS